MRASLGLGVPEGLRTGRGRGSSALERGSIVTMSARSNVTDTDEMEEYLRGLGDLR
jgi:hypothetical protein